MTSARNQIVNFAEGGSTLAHGTHVGVNHGPLLGMVLKNRYHLMTLILNWKLLAKRPLREKTALLVGEEVSIHVSTLYVRLKIYALK